MTPAKQIHIPPMSAEAFAVSEGETLRIVDVEGGQPGDLVAFNLHDLTEPFSQACTRVENRTCRPTAGHKLWTGGVPRRALFTIVADTGVHDLLYAPCSRYVLEKRFNISRDGCLEHLARALVPWEIPAHRMPDPLNLFFSVTLGTDGAIAIGNRRSCPGAHIDLQAHLDCLVAVSTCPVPREGRENSGYRIEIFE